MDLTKHEQILNSIISYLFIESEQFSQTQLYSQITEKWKWNSKIRQDRLQLQFITKYFLEFQENPFNRLRFEAFWSWKWQKNVKNGQK